MDKKVIKKVLRESVGDKITRLAVFDFDGTLLDTPLPTDENKEIYKEKTGEDWPSKGWWSRPETLNQDIFDIPVIKDVISDYKKEKATPNTMVIMLTGRIQKLSSYVEAVLASKGLKFDGYFYNTGGSTLDNKIHTMETLLKKYPTIKEIHCWDDRMEHIPHFQACGDNLKGVDFEITIVESGHH